MKLRKKSLLLSQGLTIFGIYKDLDVLSGWRMSCSWPSMTGNAQFSLYHFLFGNQLLAPFKAHHYDIYRGILVFRICEKIYNHFLTGTLNGSIYRTWNKSYIWIKIKNGTFLHNVLINGFHFFEAINAVFISISKYWNNPSAMHRHEKKLRLKMWLVTYVKLYLYIIFLKNTIFCRTYIRSDISKKF